LEVLGSCFLRFTSFFANEILFTLAEKENLSKYNLAIIQQDKLEYKFWVLIKFLKDIVSRNPGIKGYDLMNLVDNLVKQVKVWIDF